MSGVRRKVYFDGGCRPNPGRMEAAVVVRGETHRWTDMGHGSNTDAEWLALLHGLRVGLETGTDFVLLGDSAVVIAQANGTQPCRDPRLQAYRDMFVALAGTRDVRLRKIGRAQNLAGIALATDHPR